MDFDFPIKIKYKKQFQLLMEALEKEGYYWVEGQKPTEFYPECFPHFSIAICLSETKKRIYYQTIY